ncbi:hypothetical protein JTB14_017702 [Gonioctena quinquepunctata]|nr:hypothetical protein JTB14_017702 [Gonioctena quinquepunctata]
MLHVAPIGSDESKHPSGWMTSTNFVKYMHHFAKYPKPTPSSAVLLSFIFLWKFLISEEKPVIILLTFPPYCNFRSDWMVSNTDETVTIYDIPKLAALAIPQVIKQLDIRREFEKSAIWPSNSDIC